ncbi:MAG: hypothetical protein JRN10_00735 [Nitrososphaerota archaeon]|jgi:hypothetical protein|nr:hypothetical protein [Nitrososphaerota archaeon]
MVAKILGGILCILEWIMSLFLFFASGRSIVGWLFYIFFSFYQALQPVAPPSAQPGLGLIALTSFTTLYLLELFELIGMPILGMYLIKSGMDSNQ